MYKKTIFVVIGLVVILGLGAWAFNRYQHSLLNSPKMADQSQAQGVTIEDKKIADATKPFKIDITYPAIAGQDDFNAKAQGIVNSELAIFKKNSLENDAAIKENDPQSYAKYPREYDLIISYDKGQVDGDMASIIFDVSNFEGGAHGAHYFIPLNYSFKNHQEIMLADLFAGQPDYLKKISDYCVANLTKQITTAMGTTDGTWIQDGAGPKEENFSVFKIESNAITFYFPQYQVAPYAAGDFKVTMPR